MTPERWAQIEELFHRATECEPDRRTALLDDACRTDAELRREVEALLSCEASAGNHVQAAVHSELHDFSFSLIGEVVSHYRILDGLGGGGMGLVYRAEDLRLGRQVALKFLPEESAKDPAALARFEREARAASALEHPNICPIYEFGDHAGQPFLAMPLLEGETLKQVLERGREPDDSLGNSSEPSSIPAAAALSMEETLDLAIQILNGLQAAHQKGIIHRDIKPANIFITGEKQAKILDFGLAKLAHVESEDYGDPPHDRSNCRGAILSITADAVLDPLLSRAGVAMGTAGYMSPEQIRGENLDTRTDLFSFGLVLYEMATGRRALEGDTLALSDAILSVSPIPARERNTKISVNFEGILRKALEKDRNLRYQTASEMRADLQSEAEAYRQSIHKELTKRASGVPLSSSTIRFGNLRNRFWTRAVPAGALAVSIFGLLFYSHMHRAPPLHETDSVLVSDFVNTTGEPILDGTLREAATIKLAESPFFNLVPSTRTRQIFTSLNLSQDQPLLPPISRKVCQRAGARVVIGGSVGSVSNGYVLHLNAVDCRTGTKIANETRQASNREQILTELGNALPSLRHKLGEPTVLIQRFDTRLDQATTTSLEALKAYTSGEEERARGKEGESIPSYKLAIELDPNFAMAYAKLAAVFRSVNQVDLADQYVRAAFDRREHVSIKEKLYIQARYYSDTAREPDSEIETYRLWSEMYPRDFVAFNGLTSGYIEIGQPERAIQSGIQALQISADHALAYAALARAYERAGQFDHAKTICDKAAAENVDSFWTHMVLYRIAFVEGDGAAMQREGDWFRDKPQESVSIYFQAKAALARGEVHRSRELFESARRIAEKKRRSNELVAAFANGEAQFEADMGYSEDAQAMAGTALRLTPDSARHEAFAALALARSGDSRRAAALMRKIRKRPLLGTALKDVVFPCIRAAIELNRKRPRAAIDALQPSMRYDLGTDSSGVTLYYRGLAYLQLRSPDDAIAQFQKIVENRGVVMTDVYWPLAHLGLARAYAMLNDSDKSIAAYREVLTFWANADADCPIVREARLEHAKVATKARSDSRRHSGVARRG